MTQLRITVPKPPKEVHPNARCHWAVKAKAVKKYRNLCGVLAAEATLAIGPLEWTNADWSAIFYVKDQRGMKQDEDNAIASLKSTMDGLADAGIIENDRGLRCKGVTFAIQPDRAGTVEIEIWQA